MSLPVFVPAAGRGPEALAALFTGCYRGYYVPMTLAAPDFEHMARLCDYDLERSRVALLDGVPAGLAVLAARGTRGWIGGMGVVPEARGRGLGTALMRAVLAAGRDLGLRSVDLEVLVQNAPAIRIYEELGFRRTRGLEVWSLEPGEVPAPGVEVAAVDPRRCLAEFDSLHPARSPWQRDRATLERAIGSMFAFGRPAGGRLAGWVLYRPASGRVNLADLVALPEDAPRCLDALLVAVARAHPGQGMRLLNLPEGDPAAPALARLGGRIDERQIEMTLGL